MYCSLRVDIYHTCLWDITIVRLQAGHSGVASKPSCVGCVFDGWHALIPYIKQVCGQVY